MSAAIRRIFQQRKQTTLYSVSTKEQLLGSSYTRLFEVGRTRSYARAQFRPFGSTASETPYFSRLFFRSSTTLWAARLPSRVLCKASTLLPEEDTGALSTTACPKPVICNNDAHLRIFAISFKDFFFPRACLCIMVVPKEIPVSTESFSAPYVLRFLISVSRFSSSFSLLGLFFC